MLMSMKLPKKLSNQVKKKKLTEENNDLKTEIRHLELMLKHTNKKLDLLIKYGEDIEKDISDIKNTF